jgi:carboxypeptidase family protein/TonB-dependent receptor-like protein
MRVRLVAWLLAAMCSAATVVAAQVTTGSIVGTVTDTQGQVVPGATVAIREIGKQTVTTVVSDENGNYVAPFLNPGTYEVSVELSGFKKYIRQGVIVQVNDRARIDASLEVGQLTEVTTVIAAAPLVKTESSEIGTVIEEKAIRELPLNGRNFASLVYLVPGITPGQQGENLSGASTFNPRGASNFNALGQQANTNGWLVDGIDNNEFTFNTVIVAPSVESVREFKVLNGVFSAEFGRGAGVVSVSTKSGSNEYRGTVFDFIRNDVFDAYGYFAPRTRADGSKIDKPPLRRHQFGGAIGGPLTIKGLYNGTNRTFFFADYSGLKETRGLSFINTVPTAATRNGDFSDYRTAAGALIVIYDPLTTRLNPNFNPGAPVSASNPQFLRDPFPGNVIPQDRIHPVGRNVASIYPMPNGAGNFNNFTINTNREVTENQVTGRVDHRLSDSDSFFVRFTYGKFKLDAPQGQAACCLPTPAEAAARFDLGPFVAGIQNTRLTTHGLAFNHTKIIGTGFVNEFRFGYARTLPFTTQSDYGHDAATSLGIQGINVNEITTGLPNINVTNFTGLSGGPAFLPVNPKQIHYQFEDALVQVKGRHQLKYGYRFVWRTPSPLTHDNTRSNLNVGVNFVNNPVNNTGGTGLATLLLGFVNNGSRGFLERTYVLDVYEHGAFIQDDFKLRNNVTVNAGLRYEIFTPGVERENRITNYDPVGKRFVYAGEDGASRSANKKTQYGNWAPRLGMAWDLFGNASTVLRTGYGITYFPMPHAAGNMIGLQVPWAVSQNFSTETNPLNYSNLPMISNPFGPIVPIQPRTTAELNAANPRVLGHSFENETPYTQQWHLGIERALFQNYMVEVGYIGSKGTHLVFGYNPNEVQPGIGSQASRRLIPELNNISNMIQFDPRNRSTYHAGILKLQRRFASGVQFLSSYTFAKSLDYGGSAASGGGQTGGPQTVTNLNAGKGPSGFDVRHRWVFSWVWELPFGQDKPWVNEGFMSQIVGGWQLSGIATFQGGRPFNVNLQTGVNNGAPSWPNRIGDGTLEDPDRALWFDPTAFVAPPPNTYGDVGRGILYSPGQKNIDASLQRRFGFFGDSSLMIRLDAFNVTNTPYFGFPNANIGSPTVGQITTLNGDNRILQLALKLDF